MAFNFGTEQQHKGSFRAEDLKFTLGGKDAVLVQQVQFTLNRTVNMLYEVGSNNVYYVGNRRQGQCQMSRVVGGNSQMVQLVKDYGDMCNPKELTLDATGNGGGKCAQAKRKYILKNATLTSIGASVTAQDIVLTENLSFIFADLDDQ
ncbi:hypothetical protein EBZ80_20390 [bacterium]|jgi:hypothetical protein|nr:hypothetical protein [Betaproteobacteria bacterium]NDE17287.1 hypothetical protein [bacterium]